MNELNRKLAKWAGLEISRWMDPVTKIAREGEMPNFTESLDACFKYLVPKVASWRVVIYQNAAGGCTSYIDSKCKCRLWEETLSSAKDPALALCLAIEKLIDKEEHNEGDENTTPTT